MADFITYENDTFKCIDCIAEYSGYHSIYVARKPHVDENGREYQVINTQWGREKILHPVYSTVQNNGYLQVRLPAIRGKVRGAYVHRLVILTWCGLPTNYQVLQVNHIDESKKNNRLDNLELVTARDNCVWGTRLKRIHDTKVNAGQTTRVVAFDTVLAREYHYASIHECAEDLHLDRSSIYRCLNGRQRQTRGFVFCREDGKTK